MIYLVSNHPEDFFNVAVIRNDLAARRTNVQGDNNHN